MRKFNSISYVVLRWAREVADPIKFITSGPRYLDFFMDWHRYSRLKGAEPIKISETWPCIHDKTETTDFDHHYFYQDIWAFNKIYKSKVDCHVDVGSLVYFVGFLTRITKVIFIDIRPLMATLDNFESRRGSVLSLPFEDSSVKSLSCLHVAEHIGLGRYGDPLEPLGTKKACKELSRILAVNGNLYFSIPVGRPRLCFNGCRVHAPRQIVEYFNDLELVEFSGVDDGGNYLNNIDLSKLEDSDYACGFFWFTKKK